MTKKKIESFAVSAASARLQGMASNDKFRPNMHGVHFDGKRKLAIATDGNGIAFDYLGDEPAPLGRTVEFGKLKGIKPGEPKAYKFTVTNAPAEGDCVELTRKGTARLLPEDVQFPDWQQAIPAPVTSFAVALDAALLTRLADAICEGSGRYVTLQFDITRPETAGIVVAPHVGTGCGVLMPCKREPDEEDPLPRLKKLVGK